MTGLVLAGGRGLRMGGLDKGLLLHRGVPLAERALRRLGPQVGPLCVSANRNAAAYAAFGAPVLADTVGGHAGPLAGWLAGLQALGTEWLVSVPCDVPAFPLDLVQRLASALSQRPLAVAAGADGRLEPVFCLLHRSLAAPLAAALAAGERRVQAWVLAQGAAIARFDAPGDDAVAAFANLNTPAALQTPQGPSAGGGGPRSGRAPGAAD